MSDAPSYPYKKPYLIIEKEEERILLMQKMLNELNSIYDDFLQKINATFQLPAENMKNADTRLSEGMMWLEKGVLKMPILTKESLAELQAQQDRDKTKL